MVDFSVVLPIYNEAEGLNACYAALTSVIDQLDHSFEIVMVNDGSDDASFQLVEKLAAADPRVRGLSLSRNFGHQVALTAGLDHARGEAVITMDADLQHPPEVIPQLIEQYHLGYDVVYTVRLESDATGSFKQHTSRMFYNLINRLADVRIEPAAADFRLMSAKAVAGYKKFSEKGRFTRGLVQWMGFRQVAVSFTVAPRIAGRSKYTFKKMLRFAFDGITAFSSKPLRWAFGLGFVLLAFAVVYSLFAVFVYLRQETVPGWTSILISVLMLGAVQLLCIGLLGEYVARIFDEVKDRPLYLVQSDTSDSESEKCETAEDEVGSPRDAASQT